MWSSIVLRSVLPTNIYHHIVRWKAERALAKVENKILEAEIIDAQNRAQKMGKEFFIGID